MEKRIYLDHAATTYVDPKVKDAMDKYFEEDFGNPSSIYREGRKAKEVIGNARKSIADFLHCKSDEIIFTSGGTESNNLAIFGVARSGKNKGHIITTKIEHHSVLNPLHVLEKEGFDVTYLDVGEDGIVKIEDVKNALRDDTILVSIMYANNEIGTIQPIEEIGKLLENHSALFHIDACQASGYLDMNVEKLGVDLMTVNGSKMYGPKGVGFLYIRNGIKLNPMVYGGGQEKGLRPGTENVPAIVGLAEAFKIAHENKGSEVKRLTELRDYFIKRLTTEIPKTFLNGHSEKRLPNNVNVSFLDIEGESIILYLDEAGIACSTGSACSSESIDPSHVIMALGKGFEYGHGSIRFSLGKRTQKKDLDYVMEVLSDIIKKLRSISVVK